MQQVPPLGRRQARVSARSPGRGSSPCRRRCDRRTGSAGPTEPAAGAVDRLRHDHGVADGERGHPAGGAGRAPGPAPGPGRAEPARPGRSRRPGRRRRTRPRRTDPAGAPDTARTRDVPPEPPTATARPTQSHAALPADPGPADDARVPAPPARPANPRARPVPARRPGRRRAPGRARAAGGTVARPLQQPDGGGQPGQPDHRVPAPDRAGHGARPWAWSPTPTPSPTRCR